MRPSCSAFAHTYTQMLIAALGVGLAGGSFAVGVAYVSRFYPAGKQGTALGIFGVGNVGAAVTKFAAPFVLLAWGWQTVALVWAAALVIMAVVFWFTTADDPVIKRAAHHGRRSRSSFIAELAPLKDVRVWRFALLLLLRLRRASSRWRCGCRAISSASTASDWRPPA